MVYTLTIGSIKENQNYSNLMGKSGGDQGRSYR